MYYHYKIKLYESIIFDSATITDFNGYLAIDLAKQAAQLKAVNAQIKYDRITVYSTDPETDKRIYNNVLRFQLSNPNVGTCHRCGLPWTVCDSKSIMIINPVGIFALCIYCWNQSTEDERLTFYKALYYNHKAMYQSLEESNTTYGVQDVIDAVKRTK